MAATRDYAIGQQLVRQAGDHQIIATIGVDSVNVTVWRGMHRIDGWSHTYPTQAEAFAEAHRARLAFERYDTAEQITTRVDQLATVIREQEGRKRRRMHNPAVLDAAEAEYDSLLTDRKSVV